MTAFADAMAALTADANLGTEAVWRAGGTGPPVPVRLLRSSPDRLSGGFGTDILSATDILLVAIAALPALASGDIFTIGAELLTVIHAERDASGTVWRVFCQR